jgi:hypothetical protein
VLIRGGFSRNILRIGNGLRLPHHLNLDQLFLGLLLGVKNAVQLRTLVTNPLLYIPSDEAGYTYSLMIVLIIDNIRIPIKELKSNPLDATL